MPGRHLLVTNDFPPKTGGIQNYLWELWSRLPSDETMVYTSRYRDSAAFDTAAPIPIIRSRDFWLLPLPHLVRQINKLISRYSIDLVLIDPALPAGLMGTHLHCPYAVLVHGAEIAVFAKLGGTRGLLKKVLRDSCGIIASSNYPADVCRRVLHGESYLQSLRRRTRSLRQRTQSLDTGELAYPIGESPPIHVIPPSADVERFVPMKAEQRSEARRGFGLAENTPVIVSVSRLVPRKGMDILIKASVELAAIHDGLQVLIAGEGRERRRLVRLAGRINAPVRFLGCLPDGNMAELYGCADVFAMLCRSRWAGLEQEGFGIVFMEAAAMGVPQVAGDSGGVRDAVVHEQTGIVLEEITPSAAATAISELLTDDENLRIMGETARQRAVEDFSCDVLVARLRGIIRELTGGVA